MVHRFRPLVRWFAAVVCASFASVLLAASPPPAFGPSPVLVVFTFKTADGIDPNEGRLYATLLGAALSKLDGIKVVMGDPALTATDFLHATAQANGDYYLTGFVSAIGGGNAGVLEQIVSRKSGTSVWGNTAHVAADQDIATQAPLIRDALVAYAGRGYYAIVNATPTPIPTKFDPKKKNGIEGSFGKGGPAATPRPPLDLPPEAYGFSSKPTAPPKTYASAAHPSRFVVVSITGQTVPDVIKQYTLNSLVSTLAHHGQTAMQADPDATKHFLMHPHDTCQETGSTFLVFGTVSTKSTDPTTGADSWTDARLTPMVYDCTTQEYNRSARPIAASAFNWRTAIDRATLKATTDFLGKLGKTNAHA